MGRVRGWGVRGQPQVREYWDEEDMKTQQHLYIEIWKITIVLFLFASKLQHSVCEACSASL